MRTRFVTCRLHPRRRTYVSELVTMFTLSAILLGIAFIPLVAENIDTILRVQDVAAHR